MRTYSQGRSLSALTLVLTAAATTLLFASGRSASAQTITTNPSSGTFAIRAGIFLPNNNRIDNNVGKVFAGGGVDYILQHSGPLSTTFVSVDYLDRTSAGNHLRVIPLTVGQASYSGSTGHTHTYTLYGAGVYFVNANLPNGQSALPESTNGTVYGGYLGAGVTLTQNLFVEGRYHFTTSTNSVNASGLQLTAGIRF